MPKSAAAPDTLLPAEGADDEVARMAIQVLHTRVCRAITFQVCRSCSACVCWFGGLRSGTKCIIVWTVVCRQPLTYKSEAGQ